MCLAENIYHIACGCWQGHHITHPCPRKPHPRHPNCCPDLSCPDLSCSGVFRKSGKCLACRRLEAQHRNLFPLPLPPPTPLPSPPPHHRPTTLDQGDRCADEDEDEEENRRGKFALLAEVLRRAVDVRVERDGSASRSRSRSGSGINTASRSRFLDDSSDDVTPLDTANGKTLFIKASEQTFETQSTAWHQN
ncbi:hypothetical protein BDP81DRAFT_389744 [Colletotrichum phormii]|uniref:Uncharacterized protein n=1 Tax=Colletotrichum phormii TaxID=359342 RepID=A0AAJ0A1F1_9PEZI|nr:uncharacterized protein BDP81DRAFT_389744 [Colletotrichum phormii]KAK1654695.1 hypothetical protein BDP81DRAFT_389744 [Colletotrichum phormii]